jgi:hypothetical protein
MYVSKSTAEVVPPPGKAGNILQLTCTPMMSSTN